tara:strand:- start:263 stop:526 length:264 start_codon:yes stop_codon:yes gene_type:complete
MRSITTMTMHKGRGNNLKDSPSTIKELEEQTAFSIQFLLKTIEHLRSQLYFPVTVEGMELQRTWQDQCAVLEAENTQLKEKLDNTIK